MGDGEQFNRIVPAVTEAGLDESQWPEASKLIDECCGLIGNHLTIIRGDSPKNAQFQFGRLYLHGEPNEELERTYVENYFTIDERLPRYFDLPDSAPVHVNSLVTDFVRRNSATYNEFLAPSGGGNSLMVRMVGPHGLNIIWLLAHTGKPNDWSGDQIKRATSLLPHLRHFARVRQTLADADASRTRSMMDLLLNERFGAILLDRWGRIVEANDRARTLLRRQEGLKDSRGFLIACRTADNVRLRKLLARVLPGACEGPAGGSMPVHRQASPPLALHATPMFGASPDIGPRSVAALIIIADPLEAPQIDEGRLSAALGLTSMQSRVAAMLASGGTVQSIAAAMHRSTETVRWHIKQIMAQFQLSRQADIVRLVLSTPGVFVTR